MCVCVCVCVCVVCVLCVVGKHKARKQLPSLSVVRVLCVVFVLCGQELSTQEITVCCVLCGHASNHSQYASLQNPYSARI